MSDYLKCEICFYVFVVLTQAFILPKPLEKLDPLFFHQRTQDMVTFSSSRSISSEIKLFQDIRDMLGTSTSVLSGYFFNGKPRM